MKYRIYVAALLLAPLCAQAENVSGKSFFSDFQDYSLYSLNGYMLTVDQHHDEGHVLNKPQISATVFGGRSYDVEGLREYFLFNGKNSLRVKEYATVAPGNALAQKDQDILFGDFNVQTQAGTQNSIITMNPQQKRIGFAFSLRYPFKEEFWATLEAPFVHLQNNLNLEERYDGNPLITIGGAAGFDGANPTVTTLFEAFRQKGMNYGRIDGVQKKAGLADLTVRLGYNSVNREDLFMSQNVGVILPTGNRPTAKYVWEPIVGNNHHFGVVGGATTHFCAHQADNGNKVWITTSVEGKMLAQNTQKRSLDLKNGPWTRYLAMFANSAARTANTQTFGINLMTQDVKVCPGASASFATQLSLMGDKWNLNLGMISRYRQAEKVKLAQDWVQGAQIANIGGTAPGSVIPGRRMGECINNNAAIAGGAAPTDFFITQDDIDFGSAAHTNIMAYTVHASAAYYHHTGHPQNYELGGSYEFSRQNTAIDRWSVWAKLQLTF